MICPDYAHFWFITLVALLTAKNLKFSYRNRTCITLETAPNLLIYNIIILIFSWVNVSRVYGNEFKVIDLKTVDNVTGGLYEN